ncbi:MAG: hypothetical protein IKH12_05775 [Clostridia bacterium]|nr:hypothetical protein [Clostridia bacterium]
MKKLISVLLAILMVFSVVTVAFAAEGEGAGAAEEPAATEENKNEAFDAIVKLLIGDGTIENIPLGTAKAGLKVAKIFLKLAKAFLKVGDALGFIDGDKIFLDLVNTIAGKMSNGDDTAPADEGTTVPAENPGA